MKLAGVSAAGFHSAALYGALRGAIAPLVALLRDGEDKTRANAAGALGNLVRNSPMLCRQLVQAGALEARPLAGLVLVIRVAPAPAAGALVARPLADLRPKSLRACARRLRQTCRLEEVGSAGIIEQTSVLVFLVGALDCSRGANPARLAVRCKCTKTDSLLLQGCRGILRQAAASACRRWWRQSRGEESVLGFWYALSSSTGHPQTGCCERAQALVEAVWA